MQRSLSIAIEHYPIAGTFAISRGVKTTASVVTCSIGRDGVTGRGECVPYARYGENLQSVYDTIEALKADIVAGMSRTELLKALPAGAARNAIDCAIWDLEAKLGTADPRAATGFSRPKQVETAFTISLGTPEKMAGDAYAARHRPILKIKLGATGDPERMHAVAAAAPSSRLIADANEGWNAKNLEENLSAARKARIELVEQPVPAAQDDLLLSIGGHVPICADESAHVAEDLDDLVGIYDAVNIKLDKAGGLTAAISMKNRAEALGFKVMIGCMVGTSLAMAPAVLLAQGADFVDLDGPLLLAEDRKPGLVYNGSTINPPDTELWG